jgi:hypothetical protein
MSTATVITTRNSTYEVEPPKKKKKAEIEELPIPTSDDISESYKEFTNSLRDSGPFGFLLYHFSEVVHMNLRYQHDLMEGFAALLQLFKVYKYPAIDRNESAQTCLTTNGYSSLHALNDTVFSGNSFNLTTRLFGLVWEDHICCKECNFGYRELSYGAVLGLPFCPTVKKDKGGVCEKNGFKLPKYSEPQSIHTMLHAFSFGYLRDDEETIVCGKCNESAVHVERRYFNLDFLPEVLMVSVLRNDFTCSAKCRNSNMKNIKNKSGIKLMESMELDLRDFCLSHKKKSEECVTKYKLFAFISDTGGDDVTSNHFVSTIRLTKHQSWFKFNDMKTVEPTEVPNCSTTVQCLCYVRVDCETTHIL